MSCSILTFTGQLPVNVILLTCQSHVILLTCRRNVFMASILRYANIHWMLRYICVHTSIYTDVLYLYAQDTIVVVPPYPYCIEEDHNDVLGRLLVCTSPALLQVLFASEAWKGAEEHDIQSRSRYIQVYTCISKLCIIICTFLTMSYQMICSVTLYSSTPLRS